VTRALKFVIRNWPLKLAALVFATVLYGLLVVSQNQRSINVNVPIKAVNQPTDLVVRSNLDSVTQVKFFAPQDTAPLDSASFRAEVDLTNVDPRAGAVSVPVHLRPIDDRIQVLEVFPTRITVDVDQLVSRSVPVAVDEGTVPAAFDVRPAVVSMEQVTVRGPDSVIRRVDRAEARIQIDPSGIDFDRDVELIPVDALGEELRPVDVEPSTVRVRVPVFTDRRTRSLPVRPNVPGAPAAGFEVASISVLPVVVTVEGDADQLAGLTSVDTAPISTNGATSDITADLGLALPTGVLPIGGDTVHVTIAIRQVTATRNFSTGIALAGARSDRTYVLSTDRVLVTIGGSVADLDALQGRSFDVQVSVATLEPGRHDVKITANLPSGLTLVAASPATVTVTVGVPAASAAPTPTP
jgi:YbbR domain-containing protein